MKKLLTQKRLSNILMIFIVLSIFLDFHVFYSPIATLIRCIIISVLFLIVLILYNKPKDIKKLFIYFFIIVIYITMHHINALNFKSLVPNNFNYSLLKELLYFFKMLSNIMLFYIVYRLNIKYIDIKKYIKIIVCIISLTIIVSDLFCVSYTAYNLEKTSIPIFKWFFYEKYDFMSGSSKGFFHLTNQIVALLLLYYPIIMCESFKEKKIINYILLFSVPISMLMIGNRLAVYGTLIEIFILTIIYFTLNIKNKPNRLFFISSFIIFVAIILMIPYSPLTMRGYYYDAIYSGESISFVDEVNANKSFEESYIKNKNNDKLIDKFSEKNIDPLFTMTSYPYKYDRKFWNNMVKQDVKLTGNARYMELSIAKRIKKINNNKWDKYFGLTYTRVINAFNIEQDFVMQYYSIGIIGIILFLGLYIYIILYSIIKILFDLKNKFNEKNISLLFGSSFMLFSSYYSGNILNSISMIIPLTLILSVLYNEVNEKKKFTSKEKILGFDVSTDNSKNIVKKIFSADGKVFVVNINPLIILDHYKDEEKKKIFNQQIIQIPDGEGIVLASKLKGGNINKRIAGIDMMLEICKASGKYKKSIFLYGAKEKVAEMAKNNLEKKYKDINIVGTISGYTLEKDVIKAINKSKAEIIFVALGSPKQEDFIIRNMNKLKYAKIFVPVGGSFDVISGNLKRAPKIIQKLKLEWLYRMILEPKRISGIFKLFYFLILNIFEK